jgi:hypothetical protein
MKIYTIQSSRRKKAGMPVEDISTRPENGPMRKAIPDWEMLSAYMHGKMTEEEYHDKYLAILDENKEALIEHFREIENLPGYNRFAISCNCNPGHFCQRKLMAEWIQKNLGWEYGGEIV